MKTAKKATDKVSRRAAVRRKSPAKTLTTVAAVATAVTSARLAIKKARLAIALAKRLKGSPSLKLAMTAARLVRRISPQASVVRRIRRVLFQIPVVGPIIGVLR